MNGPQQESETTNSTNLPRDLVVGEFDCTVNAILSILGESPVLSELRSKWSDVARELGTKGDDKESIRQNYKRPIDIMEKVINLWIAGEGQNAKLTIFISALRNVGLTQMAEKLEESFGVMTEAASHSEQNEHHGISIPVNQNEETETPTLGQQEADESWQLARNGIKDFKCDSYTKRPSKLCSKERTFKLLTILLIVAVVGIFLGSGVFATNDINKPPRSLAIPQTSSAKSLRCLEKLYSGKAVTVVAYNYLNYRDKMQKLSLGSNDTSIFLSLEISNPNDWFPSIELYKAELIAELHVRGNICIESLFSLLRQVVCAKKVNLQFNMLTSCTVQYLNSNVVVLPQLEALTINSTLSNNSDLFYNGIRRGRVKLEGLTRLEIVDDNIEGTNVDCITDIITHSNNLTFIQIPGTVLSRKFFNLKPPAPSVKCILLNQSNRGQVDGDVLELSSKLCAAFPNLEAFNSGKIRLNFKDRYTLFKCKELQELRVRLKIDVTKDMLGDIGITSRLKKIQGVNFYLEFSGNTCPTIAKMGDLGLKKLCDDENITMLNVSSNCEIEPGSSSMSRATKLKRKFSCQ